MPLKIHTQSLPLSILWLSAYLCWIQKDQSHHLWCIPSGASMFTSHPCMSVLTLLVQCCLNSVSFFLQKLIWFWIVICFYSWEISIDLLREWAVVKHENTQPSQERKKNPFVHDTADVFTAPLKLTLEMFHNCGPFCHRWLGQTVECDLWWEVSTYDIWCTQTTSREASLEGLYCVCSWNWVSRSFFNFNFWLL